ncbi:unnamed protein product [Soboliphyme baturini]|uniref:Pectinesterase n=1 Tax=Soboliphyme baturini TaxID=241478 RepID=A0A183IBR8_9BILA|nr:unnamed protein product [Soboliphyme baturini]
MDNNVVATIAAHGTNRVSKEVTVIAEGIVVFERCQIDKQGEARFLSVIAAIFWRAFSNRRFCGSRGPWEVSINFTNGQLHAFRKASALATSRCGADSDQIVVTRRQTPSFGDCPATASTSCRRKELKTQSFTQVNRNAELIYPPIEAQKHRRCELLHSAMLASDSNRHLELAKHLE